MSSWTRYTVKQGFQKAGKRVLFALSSFGLLVGGGLTMALSGAVSADNSSVNFENLPYVTGNINGQQGWSKTGPYDVAVVPNIYGYTSFGAQSLRLSNSVTSGSFGDQTFAPKLAEPSGEADALDVNGSPV